MIVNRAASISYNNFNRLVKNNNTNFYGKNDKETIKVISLKDADNLKYDVEYNKLSRFKNNFNIIGDNIDIIVINGINGSKVTGNAYNHNIDAKYICPGYNSNKMIIKGNIDGKNIFLKYNIMGNNVNIEGDLSELDNQTITLLNMLARDYSEVANNQINAATTIMLALP